MLNLQYLHRLFGWMENPSLPRFATAYVEIADAAGDRNQHHLVGEIVAKEYPDISHRVLCSEGRGVYRLSPRYRVLEGGFDLGVQRSRADGIAMDDYGRLLDMSRLLVAHHLTLLVLPHPVPLAA